MKKKLLTMISIALLGAAVAGCGAKNPEVITSVPSEKIESSTTEEGPVETESMRKDMESVAEETVEPVETEKFAETAQPAETTELTFADLSKRRFEFSSGAGGWREEFTIERDGYFTGRYYDLDMGSTGEGYEDGTWYSSSYSGHFADLVKVNEYTYEMTLADMSYKEAVGTQEIIDKNLYIYTESYCLGGNDTFTVYLPGTPLSSLSEEIWIWIHSYNQSDTELTMPIIVDEKNGYGIYSHERLSPLEDAQATFANYQESFDYYNQLISETSTTIEWVEYTGRLYELSDECLNYLWNLIRYNMDEERYQEILIEQREWIKEKEATAIAARDEWEGGSFAPVAYNDMLATLTIERCKELIEYLE